MIQLPLTPEEFTARAAQLAEKQGITLTGHEGMIERFGVKAGYKYADGLLTVDILDKPFFLTMEQCELQLKSWISSH